MDAFVAASPTPCAAQPDIGLLAHRRQRRRRQVVQEFPERAAAEITVLARVQNELVPEVVRHPRRHRHVFAIAAQMHEKELPQRLLDVPAVSRREPGPLFGESLQQAGGHL
ncbi:hypothetical protein ACFSUI_19150 [Ralstonia solanacearum]